MSDVLERDFIDGQDLVVNTKPAIVLGSTYRSLVRGGKNYAKNIPPSMILVT